jgi:hypothetical protein
MPAKNVCEPTQFDGVGAHGRSISVDLDPDQPATIFRNPKSGLSAGTAARRSMEVFIRVFGADHFAGLQPEIVAPVANPSYTDYFIVYGNCGVLQRPPGNPVAKSAGIWLIEEPNVAWPEIDLSGLLLGQVLI